MIPFLTGLVVDPIELINVNSQVDHNRNDTFDDLPFIWNGYEKIGYLTWFNVNFF